MRGLAVMPTIPSRVASAARVVARLLPQVERLVVYLNGHGAVPAWATQPRVRPVLRPAGTGPGVRFEVGDDLLSSFDVVIFSDDDLDYPPNHVQRAAADLTRLGPGVVIAYHGSVWPTGAEPRYELRRCTPYFASARVDQRVACMGSGTLALRAKDLACVQDRRPPPDLDREDDIWFSAAAARAGLRAVRPRTPAGRIHALPTADPGLFGAASAGGFRRRNEAIRRMLAMGGWRLDARPDDGRP